MAPKVIKTTFLLRRGLAEEWTSVNPVLALAEPGFEKDTYRLKIGDGITPWNSLPYLNNGDAALHYLGMATLAAGETVEHALERIVSDYQATYPSYTLDAGAIAIVDTGEYIYNGTVWQEFGNESLYETKAEAQAAYEELQNLLNLEAVARTNADAAKVDREIAGPNGTAIIFNKSDGGGAKFEHNDGTESFVGVNDGGQNGLVAQIYADKFVDGKWQGAKLDVTNNGMYYTVGNKSFAQRAIADNEIATKGNVQSAIDAKELTAGAGLVIESQAVGLLPKYNNYLVRATFEKPVLSLTMSGVGGAKEIGTPLTISTITHRETHADNIASGTLKFYRNGTAVQTIMPSASSATVTLDESITEAGTSAGSVSYKLQCTDTLGDTQASGTITATWYRYVYSQVGDPATVPTSAANCDKQANLATFAANGADFTYAVGDCIWLLTTNANAKIQTNVLGQWVDVTYYSEGSVTFTQANGATATYYAYRTDAFIGAGTAKYRITNP